MSFDQDIRPDLTTTEARASGSSRWLNIVDVLDDYAGIIFGALSIIVIISFGLGSAAMYIHLNQGRVDNQNTVATALQDALGAKAPSKDRLPTTVNRSATDVLLVLPDGSAPICTVYTGDTLQMVTAICGDRARHIAFD